MTKAEKDKQEESIGRIFSEEYQNVTGIQLEGNVKGAEPPDRVFYYGDSKIGCEMFEVEQFHETRGFFNELEQKVYKEFECCGLIQSYQGMRIDFTADLIQTNTEKEIVKRWRERKLRGDKLAKCAKELVDLVYKSIASVDSIPVNCLPVKIDPELYPALSAFTPEVLISKLPKNDLAQSEGKDTLSVVAGGNYLRPDGNELVCKLIDEMKKKIGRKKDPSSGWQPINHSVLIAHELPRTQAYLGPIFNWPKHLKTAAEKSNLLDAFNELWFVRPVTVVTETDMVERQAQFICGNHLKPRDKGEL
jgi:hypothetical protein